jgi:hypothetical protein
LQTLATYLHSINNGTPCSSACRVNSTLKPACTGTNHDDVVFLIHHMSSLMPLSFPIDTMPPADAQA